MTSAEMVVVGMKHIVCFSGGHSSAIAAVEVVRKFGAEDTILLNHDLCPRTEDADIKRFKKQVSDYLGVPITYANMPGWDVKDQFDVCMEIKAFKAGAQSTAFCTNRLKTEPFHKWLSEHYPANPPEVRDDISLVYGFDANEQHRIRRRVGIMAAMGYQTEYPLTWEVRTIHDIEEVGIERPKTYSIFNHANCTGCLKAGKQHWFVVYCLYPKIWEKAKLAEDTIGYSILKQGYARMGEPTWNPAVLDFTESRLDDLVKECGLHAVTIHPVVSTMMPRSNNNLSSYLKHWCEIKNTQRHGEAGLQLSINSTSDDQREAQFAGKSLSLREIANIASDLPMPVGRKYTLNFAVTEATILDAKVLDSLFDRDKFIVKITPIHQTKTALEHNYDITTSYDDYSVYDKFEQPLLDLGWDVIVFVPSKEEDSDRITCGNALISEV